MAQRVDNQHPVTKLDICLDIAKPIHAIQDSLLHEVYAMIHEGKINETNYKEYVALLRRIGDGVTANVRTVLHADLPADDRCSDLVKLVSRTPSHIVFRIELTPGTKIVWACSESAVGDDEKELPWYTIVAREFEISAAFTLTDPGRVLEHGCGLEHGSLSIKAIGDYVEIQDHFNETSDGCETTGYAIMLPKGRFIRILNGIAIQVREAYAA